MVIYISKQANKNGVIRRLRLTVDAFGHTTEIAEVPCADASSLCLQVTPHQFSQYLSMLRARKESK